MDQEHWLARKRYHTALDETVLGLGPVHDVSEVRNSVPDP
jgi:hypothetical protein